MRVFAYISLKQLYGVLKGEFDNVGHNSDTKQSDRKFSNELLKNVNYIECFLDLNDVEVLQQINFGKPEFLDGGVIVRINIDQNQEGLISGKTIYRVTEGEGEKLYEVNTVQVEIRKLKVENFEDAVFDRNCCLSSEEIKEELDSVYNSRAMGE